MPNSRVQRSQDNAEKLATEFVLKTLKKRLFSSPAAFPDHARSAREIAPASQARQSRPQSHHWES